MTNYYRVLTETGIDVNRAVFASLDEASQVKVTDDVLSGMLRFVSEKYNSLDMREIERSAGDIDKFKYTGMLVANADTLRKIYEASPDEGAKNYLRVTDAVLTVIYFLQGRRRQIADLYKAGNGVIQMMYTSLVAACIFSLGILVANTIRFVTTETETDCQVLYDEIPGTIKNVHIKNILVASDSIDTFGKLIDHYSKPSNSRAMQESISYTAIVGALKAAGATAVNAAGQALPYAKAMAIAHPVLAGAASVGAILYFLPRVIVLIREIIYGIYYMRVKISDMLAIQADLINTNIESLEAGRGSRKVIARQRKIADTLTKWQNGIAVKIDNTAAAMNSQKRVENAKLKLDRNSPLIQEPGALSAGDLML